MNPLALPRRLALAALAGALLLPAAAAETGELTAGSIVYSGGAVQQGVLDALYVSDSGLSQAGGSIPAQQAVPALELRAGSVTAVVVERRYITGPTATAPNGDAFTAPSSPDPAYTNEDPAPELQFGPATAALASFQPAFQMHVLRAGLDPVAFEARTAAGGFASYAEPYIGQGDFKDGAGPTDPRGQTRDQATFWGVVLDGPQVVHRDDAGVASLTLTGDMVVELSGLSLEVRAGDDVQLVESGTWAQPLAAGTPAEPAGSRERHVLVRLFLEDATLSYSTQGGVPVAYWASPDLSSAQAGAATLLDAAGTLATASGAVQVEGTYVLAPGNTLGLAPGSGMLDVGVAPTPAATAVGPPRPEAQGAAAFVAAGAVLALLAAIGVGLLRRGFAVPAQSQVEAALEAGRYREAARLAGRILRRTPDLEDAALSRAIALSRGGRHAAAVEAIRTQLARREASDGSLHYVLGLALLDLGQPGDAREALAEAVRRTPALQADVAARLGSLPPQAVIPSPREAHGYA